MEKPGNKTSFRSEMSLETIVECLRVINGWQSLRRGGRGGEDEDEDIVSKEGSGGGM